MNKEKIKEKAKKVAKYTLGFLGVAATVTCTAILGSKINDVNETVENVRLNQGICNLGSTANRLLYDAAETGEEKSTIMRNDVIGKRCELKAIPIEDNTDEPKD